MSDALFAALLKYWRGLRGMSQLDLSVAAGVSTRHVSFLETGRAQPSEEMVLLLASVLGVPLRDQNRLLGAAGFSRRFAEGEALSPSVEQALERMMSRHEPFPLTVLSGGYDVVRSNRGAQVLFRCLLDGREPPAMLNTFDLVFDPAQLRPFVVHWERLARTMLARLQRETLFRDPDFRLSKLLQRVLAYPGVERSWLRPDVSEPLEPTVILELQRDDLSLSFLGTVTVFSAPQEVALEELRIESFFPLDAGTAAACERMMSYATTDGGAV
jgi:transcriptional regulator with XRE-family HTH domain